MLEELVKYSYANKRKFDIVAALGMAELGDEELSGIIPEERESTSNAWVDFGYYYDENGKKRWGTIQKQQITNINIQIENGNR